MMRFSNDGRYVGMALQSASKSKATLYNGCQYRVRFDGQWLVEFIPGERPSRQIGCHPAGKVVSRHSTEHEADMDARRRMEEAVRLAKEGMVRQQPIPFGEDG
jgi:hypothetical protein